MRNMGIFLVLGLVLLSFAKALPYALATTEDSLAQPGAVIMEPPTTGAWALSGVSKETRTVTRQLLAWRRTGETAWHDGLPLLRLQGEAVQQGASFHYVAPNMFAGSVFGLDPEHVVRHPASSFRSRRAGRSPPSNAL